MVGREPKNHQDDCYFCVVNIQEINRNNRKKWTYNNLELARMPIPHSEKKFPFLRWTSNQNLQKALIKLVVMLMQQCLVAVKVN